MKFPRSKFVIGFFVATLAIQVPAQAEDRYGATDPSFLPRFDGSFIRQFRPASLDEIVIPTGPIASDQQPRPVQKLQGEIAHLDYIVKPSVAPLAIDQHYRSLLREGGFEIVYSCQGTIQCGQGMASLVLNSGKVAPSGLVDGVFTDKFRLLVARKDSQWVLVHIDSAVDAAHAYVATISRTTAVP